MTTFGDACWEPAIEGRPRHKVNVRRGLQPQCNTSDDTRRRSVACKRKCPDRSGAFSIAAAAGVEPGPPTQVGSDPTRRSRREHMQRGAMTRGRYARLMAGAEAIEIKATIPEAGPGALARYRLTRTTTKSASSTSSTRPALELLKAGIVPARAASWATSTTARSSSARWTWQDRRAWRRYRDFKIEADASEKGIVKSASFSMPVEKGLIKRVAAATRASSACSPRSRKRSCRPGRAPDGLREARRAGPAEGPALGLPGPGLPLADHGRALAAWRRREADGGVGEGPGGAGRRRHWRIHGVSGRGGCRARRREQAKTRWALDYYASRLRAKRPGRKRT